MPSRAVPTGREFQHWLVGNVPGGDVDKGDSLSAYVGSGPPPKTGNLCTRRRMTPRVQPIGLTQILTIVQRIFPGLHRYVFLVYKQPSKLTFDEPRVNNRYIINNLHFQDFKNKIKNDIRLCIGNMLTSTGCVMGTYNSITSINNIILHYYTLDNTSIEESGINDIDD